MVIYGHGNFTGCEIMHCMGCPGKLTQAIKSKFQNLKSEFLNPRVLSSTLCCARVLQSRAFGFIKFLDSMVYALF